MPFGVPVAIPPHSTFHRSAAALRKSPPLWNTCRSPGNALRTDFGLRISGSPFSRPRYVLGDSPANRFTPTISTQKPSFNLFFRSEFGERPIDYPFFEGNPVTRFTDIRLRAGKNDISNPWITDELLRRMFINTGQVGSIGCLQHTVDQRSLQGILQPHRAAARGLHAGAPRKFRTLGRPAGQ